MALLLTKPILGAIKKIGATLAKKSGKNATAFNKNLKLAQKGADKLASLDNFELANILRAKYDPKLRGLIAKTLNISTPQLKAITEFITDTKARKSAITGKNFIPLIKKYAPNFEGSSIKNYTEYLEELTIDAGILFFKEVLEEVTDGAWSLPRKILKLKKYSKEVLNALIEELEELRYSDSDETYLYPSAKLTDKNIVFRGRKMDYREYIDRCYDLLTTGAHLNKIESWDDYIF